MVESKGTSKTGEVRIRVSANHLILASSVFKAMLKNKFKEATVLHTMKYLEIPLPDDDPDALLILLNIIHGHLRRVPRKISVPMLTAISVLVDKYQFHEAAEIFAEIWMDHVKPSMPAQLTEEVLSWLCISWVFKRPFEFSRVTRIIQYESSEALKDEQTASYPIPDSVIG